jgi:hypothetical protein
MMFDEKYLTSKSEKHLYKYWCAYVSSPWSCIRFVIKNNLASKVGGYRVGDRGSFLDNIISSRFHTYVQILNDHFTFMTVLQEILLIAVKFRPTLRPYQRPEWRGFDSSCSKYFCSLLHLDSLWSPLSTSIQQTLKIISPDIKRRDREANHSTLSNTEF